MAAEASRKPVRELFVHTRYHSSLMRKIPQIRYDYWKYPEKGYPRKIWWKVIAGDRNLSIIQEYDVIFDEYDYKIRKLDVPK